MHQAQLDETRVSRQSSGRLLSWPKSASSKTRFTTARRRLPQQPGCGCWACRQTGPPTGFPISFALQPEGGRWAALVARYELW